MSGMGGAHNDSGSRSQGESGRGDGGGVLDVVIAGTHAFVDDAFATSDVVAGAGVPIVQHKYDTCMFINGVL